MSAPYVGRRVVVQGLAAKPELNGTKGVAESFDDARGRYNVKMDSGGMIALKPNNLQPDGDAGGMPGMGGMPGFGGRRAGLAALLAQLMQAWQQQGGAVQLPFGLTPGQLGAGAVALLFALRAAGLGLSSGLMLGGVGLVAARAAQSGQGAVILERGRPVSNMQAAVVLGALAFFAGRYFLGGGGGATASAASGSYAAYTKGYQDGQSGRGFDPISDAAEATGGGSRWGLGTLINLAMAGGMLYQLGGGGSGQPWSPAAFSANLRQQNPMNLLILFNLVSSLFS